MNSEDITEAVTRCLYPPRRVIVLPNASWGLGISWEADLIVVQPSGHISEVEIKISASDFKADRKKRKHGIIKSSKISSLVYAMPEEIWEKCDQKLYHPEYGLILITTSRSGIHYAKWKTRQKKFNNNKISTTQINCLYRLGYLRMWDLKNSLTLGGRNDLP